MTGQDFAGAYHAVSRPGGLFVVQFLGGDLQTHHGVVPRSPGGDLLAIDLSPDGSALAGHAQADVDVYEWRGGAWDNHGLCPTGVGSCLYDGGGNLRIVPVGSDLATGYRYFEGGSRIVAQWETYDPRTPMSVARNLTLWQWTEQGDVIVGQGGEGDVVLRYQGQYRTVWASPNVTFVRFYRVGSACAVSWSDLARKSAHCRWFDVSEIPTLFPLVKTPDREPPPPPPPPPPHPGPTGPFTRAQLLDLQGDLMIWCPEVRPDWGSDPNNPAYPDAVTGIRGRGDTRQIPRGIQAGWVWTLWLPFYSGPQRQTIYRAILARGYTHVAISVSQPTAGEKGYHGLRPMTQQDADTWGAKCMAVHAELIAVGLIPICAGPAPGPADQGGATLARGFDPSVVLVAMSDWDNTPFAAERIQFTHDTFPHALVFYERPEDKAQAFPAVSPLGGDPVVPANGNGGAWLRGMVQKCPRFVGVLYEVNLPDGLDACAAQLAMANAWWRDVQQVRFEVDTYWKFWENRSQADCDAFNEALQARCPFLSGFLSGGSSHPAPGSTGGSVIVGRGFEDAIPVSAITWVGGPPIGVWAKTADLTRLELRDSGVYVEFSKKDGPDRWPDVFSAPVGGGLQYSLGLVIKRDGQWYGSAPIEMWYGELQCNGAIQKDAPGFPGIGQIAKNWFYDSRWPHLQGYQPKAGETVGFFVCAGDTRNSVISVQERSQIVTFTMPAADATATYVWTADGTPVPEPSRAPAGRFWWAPDIASADLLSLWSSPEQWPTVGQRIDVLKLYAQHINGGPVGPNAFEALVAADAFRKLREWGIPLALEIGSVKPGDCQALGYRNQIHQAVERVRSAGGRIDFLAMDDPLAGAKEGQCPNTLEQTADAVAAFIADGEALGVQVGWIEAWPTTDLETLRKFLILLDARGQLPRFWHLDIDRRKAQQADIDVRFFLRDALEIAGDYSIPVGVVLFGYDAPDEASYAADVRAWATQVYRWVPTLAHVVVQSWASRQGGGQDLPKCLPETDPDSHAGLVLTVTELWKS